MFEDLDDPESKYPIQNSKKNQRKKNKQQQQNIQKLKELFPQKTEEQLNYFLNQFKGNIEKTISYLLENDSNQQPKSQPTVSQKLDENFERLLDSSQLHNETKEDYISQYYIQSPELLKKIQAEEYSEKIEALRYELEGFDLSPEETEYNFLLGCYCNVQNWIEENDVYEQLNLETEEDKEFLLKVQAFILNKIQNDRKYDLNNEMDFPSLPTPSSQMQAKQIQKSNKDTEKAKQYSGFYFDNKQAKPSFEKKKNIWQKPTNHELYSALNPQSAAFIQELCNDFPQLNMDDIKKAFVELGDYDSTKQFLKEYYSNFYEGKKNLKNQQQRKDRKIIVALDDSPIKNQIQFNQELYKSKRQEIKDLLIKRQLFKTYVFNSKSISAKHKIQNQVNLIDSQILQLQEVTHQMVYNKISSDGQFNLPNQIDLHGFMLDELDLLLPNIINLIKKYFPSKKSIVFNVGRGQHSKNRKQVLKPGVLQFFTSANYKVESTQSDKIIVYL